MTLTKHERDQINKVAESEMDIVDIDPPLFEKLYQHYQHEMPYGTQKARTGDPYNWIADRLTGGDFNDQK